MPTELGLTAATTRALPASRARSGGALRLRFLAACTLAATILLTLPLGLAGCRAPGADREPQRGAIPPDSFRAVWQSRLDTGTYGEIDRVYLRDDLVIVYTNQNAAYVLSEAGEAQFISPGIVGPRDRLWAPVVIPTLGRIEGVDRAIVFPTPTGFVLYSEIGRRVQATALREAISSNAYAAEGLVYVGLADPHGGRVARIDPTRQVGAIRTPVLVRGPVLSRPVVYQGILYVADDAGHVWAITEGGAAAWNIRSFRTDGSVSADLAADEYGVYVASTDSVLYALDRNSGRIRWRYFAEVPLFESAIPTERHVFQAVPGLGVACINKTEGPTNRDPMWVAEGARAFLSHDDRRVYLLHRTGHIVAHDKQTGEELFRSQRTDFTRFAENRHGPRIYAATERGEIVAIEPVLTRGQVGIFVMSQPEEPPAELARAQ